MSNKLNYVEKGGGRPFPISVGRGTFFCKDDTIKALKI